ncbi:MAG: hypothetical protein AAF517_06935, partial [Planctomycetota bacterium]
ALTVGRPYDVLITGHTHFKKRAVYDEHKTYYNTGTWADVLRFSETILTGKDEGAALDELDAFLKAITAAEATVDLPGPTGLLRLRPCVILEFDDKGLKSHCLVDPAEVSEEDGKSVEVGNAVR